MKAKRTSPDIACGTAGSPPLARRRRVTGTDRHKDETQRCWNKMGSEAWKECIAAGSEALWDGYNPASAMYIWICERIGHA